MSDINDSRVIPAAACHKVVNVQKKTGRDQGGRDPLLRHSSHDDGYDKEGGHPRKKRSAQKKKDETRVQAECSALKVRNGSSARLKAV